METVAEVLNDTTAKIQKSFEALKAQFAGLRTGKASTAMVDGIQAEAWGSKQPLRNIATISTPEPRQIKITPFDPSTIDGIMKAILAANIGVTPQSDGKVVRITVPELNEERRKEIVKVAKKQARPPRRERGAQEAGEGQEDLRGRLEGRPRQGTEGDRRRHREDRRGAEGEGSRSNGRLTGRRKDLNRLNDEKELRKWQMTLK